MHDLEQALGSAVDDGIISAEQRDRLAGRLAERGLMSRPADNGGSGVFDDLSAPRDAEPVSPVEESEAPRFVRGFHDILITIGIIAALGGLAALASVFALFPAIIVLAEILVRRQRLALPAFALTLALSSAITTTVLIILDGMADKSGPVVAGTMLFFAQPLLLLPFYWRYRVPVALAMMIIGAFGLAVMLVIAVLQGLVGSSNIFETHVLLVGFVALAAALTLFATAMAFDLRDPARVTRRSDVAFWLHLGAAPALLWSVFAVAMGSSGGVGWWGNDPGPYEASVAVIAVAVMMFIGIVIDRRAFVTSGLISLGVAIVVLARAVDIEFSELGAAAILLVGLIVLTLGVGWLALRRRLLAVLPQGWRDRLPPVAA